MATYELWLLNDRGERLGLLNPPGSPSLAFFSYTRSVVGLGTIHLGIPLAEWRKINPYPFTPDLMVDVLRSPGPSYPLKRENLYFLRKANIYTREDGMEMIEFWGRDAKDLLNRRYIVQPAETSYTRKTGTIDDLMKGIVREQMQYGYCVDVNGVVDYTRAWPAGEFSVEQPFSLAPTLTDHNVSDKRVMDALRDLRNISFQKNQEDAANPKVFFDVLFGQNLAWGDIFILEEASSFEPILDETGDPLLDETSGDSTILPFAFQFLTFTGLRGADRTNGVVFSVENGNLRSPSRSIDYLDSRNTAIVRGQGRGENRITAVVQDTAAQLSRWNRVEDVVDASSETDTTVLEDEGRAELWDSRAEQILDCTFVDTPGNETTPRSLYGVDWDLGDRLPVLYGGQSYEAEVFTVYVSVNENNEENVIGRNSIDEQ